MLRTIIGLSALVASSLVCLGVAVEPHVWPIERANELRGADPFRGGWLRCRQRRCASCSVALPPWCCQECARARRAHDHHVRHQAAVGNDRAPLLAKVRDRVAAGTSHFTVGTIGVIVP